MSNISQAGFAGGQEPIVFRNPDGSVKFNAPIPPGVDAPEYLLPTPEAGVERRHKSPAGEQVGLSKSNSMPEQGDRTQINELGNAKSIDDVTEEKYTGDRPYIGGKARSIEGDAKLAVPASGAAGRSSAETTNSENSQRPAYTKKFQTERPQASRKLTIPNMMRRGTAISELNEAIWNHPNAQRRGSSSSSSSESSTSSSSASDDEVEERSPKRWQRGQKVSDKASQKSKANSRGYRKFAVGNDNYKSKGTVDKNDGRLNISVKDTSNSGYLAKAIGATFMKHIGHDQEGAKNNLDEYQQRSKEEKPGYMRRQDTGQYLITKEKRVTLNIVIMVIGSRGDIQPFLKLGKVLKEDYGHRVRIATHPAFREFVEKDSGLEFFSVGGDPAELMAFMVKNPGMIPSLETLKQGEVGKRRAAMAEMFHGFWRACINATDDEHDVHNLKMMGDRHPFVADAIIANPPSFAHVHCAERLGIPLHLMFTFPYTPTTAFPHPLANIKKTNMDPGYTNFISYPLVEMMTWQGLGDLVNDFRVNTLGLEPVSTLWAPGQLYRLRVPYTYLWSPGLVPKPADWGAEIDIAGFVFLDLASNFTPPDSLVKFLDDGPPPIYIGFGSIVVDDPDTFTKMIYEAVESAGVRALVSKGWGGFGGDDSPDCVYMLENTPHDWLFPKVKAVIHHGGAGTTAIGLKCGKPTLVVPFFGDQFFWGNMIGKAGAGAMPIPYKQLTAEKLAEAIKVLLEDETQEKADEFARKIEEEGDGAQNAVKSFHRCLTLRGEQSMRCSILEDHLAVWMVKKTNLRLSALAADILRTERKIRWDELRLLRHVEWNDFEGPGEPVTGGVTALGGSLASAAAGVAGIPMKLARSAKKRRTDEEKKARHEARAARRAKRKAKGHHPNGTISRPQAATNLSAAGQTDGCMESTPTKSSLERGIAKRDMLPDNQTPNGEAGSQGQGGVSKPATATPSRQNSAETEAGNASGDETDSTSIMTNETAESHDAADEITHDIAGGFKKTGKHLVRAPMDLSTAVAQGFHNAPRLYGDTTVRRPIRITGMHSGLKAAGQEFAYGVYDGFTGVVTQPYHGAKTGGVLGFAKGVGMGVTGFVLKDLAAIIGPIAYTMKGVQKEFGKHKQPTHFIRRARIIQGQRDLNELQGEEKKEVIKKVVHGWKVMKEIWKVMDTERQQGVKGRLRRVKERKTWRMDVEFDNVDMAEKALAAIRRGDGKTLEEVWEQQKTKLEEEGRGRMNGHKTLDQLEKERKEKGEAGELGHDGGRGQDLKTKDDTKAGRQQRKDNRADALSDAETEESDGGEEERWFEAREEAMREENDMIGTTAEAAKAGVTANGAGPVNGVAH